VAFLGVIGKRFGDGGLLDLMVESNLIAPGSVTAVLDGKQCNRAVRAHKIILEALLRHRWCNWKNGFSRNPLYWV
jgi:hypothetical protein